MLQKLAHIELKGELVSVVDFDAVPRYHVIFDPRKIEGKDRGQLLDLRALGNICLLLTRNASEALDNLWPEVSLQTLLNALHLIDEHGQVHEFLGHGDHVATLLADNVRVALAEEHLIDEGLIQSALQRLFDCLKQDTVQLLDILLLLAFVVLPAEGARQIVGGAGFAV